jgi:putative membrane protein
METVPGIFNALYKLMPMTYTVELLREVISGNDMGYAWHNALVLIGIVVIFAALTIMFAFLKRAKQKRLADITITEVEEIHV